MLGTLGGGFRSGRIFLKRVWGFPNGGEWDRRYAIGRVQGYRDVELEGRRCCWDHQQ
jgi:hypothetical protein